MAWGIVFCQGNIKVRWEAMSGLAPENEDMRTTDSETLTDIMCSAKEHGRNQEILLLGRMT